MPSAPGAENRKGDHSDSKRSRPWFKATSVVAQRSVGAASSAAVPDAAFGQGWPVSQGRGERPLGLPPPSLESSPRWGVFQRHHPWRAPRRHVQAPRLPGRVAVPCVAARRPLPQCELGSLRHGARREGSSVVAQLPAGAVSSPRWGAFQRHPGRAPRRQVQASWLPSKVVVPSVAAIIPGDSKDEGVRSAPEGVSASTVMRTADRSMAALPQQNDGEPFEDWGTSKELLTKQADLVNNPSRYSHNR